MENSLPCVGGDFIICYHESSILFDVLMMHPSRILLGFIVSLSPSAFLEYFSCVSDPFSESVVYAGCSCLGWPTSITYT